MIHNFRKIRLNLRHVSFRRISANAFYDFVPSIQSIDQISKYNTRPAILGKLHNQLISLLLIHRFKKSHIIPQPLEDPDFQLIINYLFRILRLWHSSFKLLTHHIYLSFYFNFISIRLLWLDIQSLHLAHDVVI